MITRFIYKGKVLCFFLPFTNNPMDSSIYDITEEDNIGDFDPDSCGWDRLKGLFKPCRGYRIHPDLVGLWQTSIITFLMGGVYGGIKYSRSAFIHFIESNEATQFRNHFDAKRQLADKSFIALMKGAMRWGPRVSFFCTTFATVHVLLSTYNNQDAILYYTAGGITAGGLFKSSLGLRGMIAGGIFGGVFGSLFGCMRKGLFLMAGMTEKDYRKSQAEAKLERERVYAQVQRKLTVDKQKDALTKALVEDFK